MEDFRKRLAEPSEQQGRLVEDLVAPSIPPIMSQVVDCPQAPETVSVRVYKNFLMGTIRSMVP